MSRSIGLDEELRAYVRTMNRPESEALARCRLETARLGEAARMQISPEQGAFLAFLVRLTGARNVIEIGVFTGYSALAMAEALPEAGRVFALDLSADYLAKAETYWRLAGVADRIEARCAPALDSLDALAGDGVRADLIFVDADKTGYGAYFERGLALLRPGGLIVFDNVLWSGRVCDPDAADADTAALRALAAKVRDDARVDSVFTTIGDGLLIARRVEA